MFRTPPAINTSVFDNPSMSLQQPKTRAVSLSRVNLHSEEFRFIVATGAFLIDFLVVWPVLFCALTFLLFFVIHPSKRVKTDGNYEIPTFSQTGRFLPESLFFTYGLHVEGFLLCLLFSVLYVYIKNKINSIKNTLPPAEDGVETDAPDDQDPFTTTKVHCCCDKSFKISVCEGFNYFFCCLCTPHDARKTNIQYLDFWNRVLLVVGTISALFMTWTGSVTLGVEDTVHTVFAFIMFFMAILHMILYYFALSEVMGYTQWQLNLLRGCLFVCVPFNIAMGIMILVMMSHCNNDTCAETPVQMIVVLEYTTAIALVVYMYSFREPLKDITLFTMEPPLPPTSGILTPPGETAEETKSPVDPEARAHAGAYASV